MVAGALGVAGALVASQPVAVVAPKLALALVPIQLPPTAEQIVPAHLLKLKLVAQRRVTFLR